MIPTLVAITLIAFGFLALVPLDPSVSSRVAREDETLPLFLNPQPRDVRSIATTAVARIARGDAPQEAAAPLVRAGGAALPFVLPALDALSPDERARVALALAPVAVRMGILGPEGFRTAADAVLFWSRFWEERSVDFKTSVVRRAVRRLATADSQARRTELTELDTFALEQLLAEVGEVHTREDVSRVSRLLDVASHVSGRDDRIAPDASIRAAARCAMRWNQWWLSSHADYVVLTGPARLSATILETRYGHWALHASSLRLGVGSDGIPVLDKLRRRGPRTLALIAVAELIAVSSGVLLGILSALHRDRRGHSAPTLAGVALHAASPVVLGALVALVASPRFAVAAAFLALALTLIAPSARHERLAAFDSAASDFIRAARARGAGTPRLVVTHLLRPSIATAIAIATADFPVALTGACVVERILSLRGLGAAVSTAVFARDVPFLMAFAVCGAALTAFVMLAGDLVHAWLDPRCRDKLLGEHS